jgi:hypothetical protein
MSVNGDSGKTFSNSHLGTVGEAAADSDAVRALLERFALQLLSQRYHLVQWPHVDLRVAKVFLRNKIHDSRQASGKKSRVPEPTSQTRPSTA